MIWTERELFYLPMGSEATRDYQRRWVIAMLERRAEFARAEADALKARLEEERLVADTAIRSLHMRIDADEPIVRLATGLTFHPPGSLAHSQHLLELTALVEERGRHQRAPNPQEKIKK